jgi:hypothetical protein
MTWPKKKKKLPTVPMGVMPESLEQRYQAAQRAVSSGTSGKKKPVYPVR